MKCKWIFLIVFASTVSCSFAQTQVTFYTNKGVFVVSMEETKRPITTANFLKLVKAKFYDKVLFYRVINNFMIQGGGYYSGGASATTIQDELTPAFSNLQKTIAMANAGPNTASSEIYINLVNNTSLDKNYTAFGTVISNFSVVQAIGAVPTSGSNGNPADKPLTNVVMDSVRITLVPTGVPEMENELETVDIFPDPVTDESVVSINSGSNHRATISVYNQLGEKIYSGGKNLSAGFNYVSFQEIHADVFLQGIYFLIVSGENYISRRKFILVR